MTPAGLDGRLRDAAALSLHWLRGDHEAVGEMIALALAGPEEAADLIRSLLALGERVGTALDHAAGDNGGGDDYEDVLAGFAVEASLAAEGITP